MPGQSWGGFQSCHHWGTLVVPRNTRRNTPSPVPRWAPLPGSPGGRAGPPMATAATHTMVGGTRTMEERGGARPRLTFFPPPQSRQLSGPRCGVGGPSHHPGVGGPSQWLGLGDPHTVLGLGDLRTILGLWDLLHGLGLWEQVHVV